MVVGIKKRKPSLRWYRMYIVPAGRRLYTTIFFPRQSIALMKWQYFNSSMHFLGKKILSFNIPIHLRVSKERTPNS